MYQKGAHSFACMSQCVTRCLLIKPKNFFRVLVKVVKKKIDIIFQTIENCSDKLNDGVLSNASLLERIIQGITTTQKHKNLE